MSLAKELLDRLAPEDAAIQCRKSDACFRKNLHDGECCGVAGAVALNVADEARAAMAWLRKRWA